MRISLLLFLILLSLYAQERPIYQGSFNTQSTGIYLPIDIQGEECSFLFDTGASFVVLDKSLQGLLGEPLSIEEAQAQTGLIFDTKEVITPNGKITLELYKALPLKLGKLQVANRYPYVTADLKALWPFAGEKFCGILGSSFLHQFRWELDFQKGSIEAYIGAEPYNGTYETRNALSFSRAKIPQVMIDLHGEKIVFDLDTGDNGSGRVRQEILAFLQAKKEVLKVTKEDTITVSALSTSTEFRVKNFTFAQRSYPNLVMQGSEQNAIGLALLKRHKVILDFPFKTLYLEHYDGYAQKQELDKSGLRVILKEGRLIVFSIKEVENAKLDGIKIGNEIVSLEGEKVSLYTLRQALRAKEGTVVNMEIKDENRSFQAKVVLGRHPLD